jgi:hypothetical protein
MPAKENVVVAYPGYDEEGTYNTPRPVARVKPAAAEAALKNQGSLNLFSTEPKAPTSTPRRDPRCVDGDGRRNYELGRNGSVGGMMADSTTPRPSDSARAPRAVKPEAEDIANNHQGTATANLFTSYGNQPASARRAVRVKPEAMSCAEPHLGDRMNGLLHDPKRLPESARSVPRIKPEAAVNASTEGQGMAKAIWGYGQPLSTRAVPRVKAEAAAIADQATGKPMKNLFHGYGNQPESARSAPRVKEGGQEMASMAQGGRLSRLMHDGDKMCRSPRPPPKMKTALAKHIGKASQGQIAQIFASQGQNTTVAVPGLSRSMSKTI